MCNDRQNQLRTFFSEVYEWVQILLLGKLRVCTVPIIFFVATSEINKQQFLALEDRTRNQTLGLHTTLGEKSVYIQREIARTKWKRIFMDS